MAPGYTNDHAVRGQAAIVGIGETPYYKRGTSPDPELKLCVRAIVDACEDAGISPRDVDGFVSYGSERNSGQWLFPALGTRELRFGALVWTHGGGIPGALGFAAMAVATAARPSASRSTARWPRRATAGCGRRVPERHRGSIPRQRSRGPAQLCALRSQRMLEADGVPRSAMEAMVLAAYHHARNNPHAYGRTTEIDPSTCTPSRAGSPSRTTCSTARGRTRRRGGAGRRRRTGEGLR